MLSFERYIGIDYSGAKGPDDRLPGLKVYECEVTGNIIKIVPLPEKPSWNWTRREVAGFVADVIREPESVIVGIDHAFSFPLSYFDRYRLIDWDHFLDDFIEHWPTYVQSVERLREKNKRTGERNEFRLAEQRPATRGKAKSVFQLDGQGTVGKSTHSGLPFLRSIREESGDAVHLWPFDGWQVPPGKSVIVEVYPKLFLDAYPTDNWGPNEHERDARVVAEYLRDTDRSNRMDAAMNPDLSQTEAAIASLEGWILGVS